MNNEKLIRKLIKGSIQRTIRESAAAIFVLIAFTATLADREVGSPSYYGCLIILVGTGFITGVIWSYTLSFQLLRTHAPSSVGFWREAFHAQAKLLRLVPLWYCAPLCVGGIIFSLPTSSIELLSFSITTAAIVAVFVLATLLNRRVADKIDEMAAQLG